MLGRAALEFDSAPIDSHGPDQTPVFQGPQRCKAGFTDVLAQLPVTAGKNKSALDDAPGGALGGRQGRLVAWLDHVETQNSKSEIRKSKFESLFSNSCSPVSIL
jgi:hypothetical protein